jgi:hypothetical protein
MAFTTSNVQGGMLFGPCKIFCGAYSGTAGDAPGTITLGGGEVYACLVQSQDTTGPDEDAAHSVSVSGNTITLTIYNHQTVTRGRFFIVYS